MKFRARLVPSGNATAVELPAEVVAALGPEARPQVAVTINGHGWRSRVAAMRGLKLIGISAANRAAAGITEGDLVEVTVTRDEAPREVVLPADLATALGARRAAFDRLAFGLRQKHVRDIEAAKSPEVRARRIAKLVDGLAAS